MYSLLADAALVLHLAFIVFAAAGALLVLRWPRLAWLHLPCAAWSVVVMATGWICPLTPLESWLRERAGEGAIGGSFIEHYLLPLIYPAGLTRGLQFALGALVLALNVAGYGWVLARRSRRRARPAHR